MKRYNINEQTTGCTSMEEVLEVLAVEQMLNSLPAEVRMWVSERRPHTVAEVGQLADFHKPGGRLGEEDNYRCQSGRPMGSGRSATTAA